MALTVVATIAVLVPLAHWLGRSLRPGWRPVWTALLLLTFVLLFISGVASVGVAHQTAWLLTRP